MNPMTHYGLWLVFASTILVILAIDLGALNKRKAPQSLREAAIWSAIWIGLSFSFAGAIWAFEGSERAMLYLTGYILEKTLSIDNLFVFLVLFRFFNIPDQQRQRVLHWGILGAIVLRFVFIYLGVSLIQKWTFILPAFGAILIFARAMFYLTRLKAKNTLRPHISFYEQKFHQFDLD
jgi:tellurite resistance protein TerC